MKLGRRKVQGGVAIILVAVTTAWLLTNREPSYQGRTLTEWLEEHVGPKQQGSRQTADAIRAIGTNAQPKLMAMFERKDSRVRSFLLKVADPDWIAENWRGADEDHYLAAVGFKVLGTNVASALPRLRSFVASSDRDRQVRAIAAMSCLGPFAKGDLAAALTNADASLRVAAIGVLSTNQFSPAELVSMLQPRARDSDAGVRKAVYQWLLPGQLSPGLVLPMLEIGFNDPDPSLRSIACDITGRLGPVATNALPVLERLSASDSNASVRTTARLAVAWINGGGARPGAVPARTQ